MTDYADKLERKLWVGGDSKNGLAEVQVMRDDKFSTLAITLDGNIMARFSVDREGRMRMERVNPKLIISGYVE